MLTVSAMIVGVSNHQLNRIGFVLFLAAGLLAARCARGVEASPEPELKVIPGDGPAHPGRPYRIVCEVSWNGAADEYAILPAQIEPIEWGSVNVTETRTSVRDGVNVVSQTIEITPSQPGEYQTPGIGIAYLSPETLVQPEKSGPPTHPTAPDAPPQLSAEPFALPVRPGRTLTWLSGALGALVLLSGGTWWGLRRESRKRKLRSPRPSLSLELRPVGPSSSSDLRADLAAAEAALLNARRHRVNGDHYRFYLALCQAAEMLVPAGGEQVTQLKVLAQDVGYRNARPPDDRMDADLRAIQRALNESKEARQA